jgi:heat shock protein HtpX
VVGRRTRSSAGGRTGTAIRCCLIAVALIAPIFAAIIQMAISRKREYLADANGALLTRYPPGLASALRKIAGDHEKLKVANKATEALYIYNPSATTAAGMNNAVQHPSAHRGPHQARLEAM